SVSALLDACSGQRKNLIKALRQHVQWINAANKQLVNSSNPGASYTRFVIAGLVLALFACLSLIGIFVHDLQMDAKFSFETFHAKLLRQSWGTMQKDRSVEGRPLTVGGVEFPQGIGTHADSDIVLTPNAHFSTFTGYMGVDDEVSPNVSVRFKIIGDDDAVLCESPDMTSNMEALPFRVSVQTVSKIYLRTENVDNHDSDHADWLSLEFQ